MEFGVLGPLRVTDGGTEIRLTARRHRALVAALLLRRGRPVSATALIDALWGERPPGSAPSVLRLYVSQVRRLLPEGRLVRSQSGYALQLEPGELDLDVFERLLARGAKASAGRNHELATALYAEALALWRGPALADLVDEPFAGPEAGGLDESRLQAIELWAAAMLEVGRGSETLPELQRVVADHPLREGPRRLLMLALYRDDRQPDALAVYREGRRLLVEELGLEPSDELRDLERRIHRRDPALRGGAQSPAGPVRVPVPSTVTVGRDALVDEVQQSLRSSQLLTLVGPSGIGKTRLALEVARRLEGSFVNGVHFVELAAVADPELVLPTLGRALGVPEQAERSPSASLAEALAPLNALIVLDNFEHVVEVVPELAELVRRSPELRVLVTSTTVLRVAGEAVVVVPPLGTEHARALLVQQAVAAGVPTSAVSGSNPTIDSICAHLEGSPLAIELAAPWLRTLAPDDLLERLGTRLGLAGRSRGAAARHRSLRAAIDWSFDLLPAREREVFLGVAPFVGGFDLASFEAVVGPDSVNALAALVDASLVQAADGRYRLLESVHDYAVEKLDPERAEWRRHVTTFTELAETAEAQLAGPDQGRWLARLDAEHDNFRAALDRLAGWSEFEAELRLAAALGRFWYLRGHIAEGLALLGRALEHTEELATPLRAKALRLRSALALIRGDYSTARGLAEAALSLNRELGDEEAVVRTLSNLGAILHAQGDLAHAAATLDECIERGSTLGDTRLLALAQNNRGDVALSQGDLGTAAIRFEQSLAAMRELGDLANVARALYNVGAVGLEQDDLDRAVSCFAESVELAHEIGDLEDVVWCTIGIAAAACRSGRHEEAGRLVGFVDECLHSMGAEMKLNERRLYATTRETLAASLSEAALSGLLEEGARLERAGAVDLAGEIALTVRAAPRRRRSTTR